MLSRPKIESLVLSIHRRNGGGLQSLDFSWRLLEPALGIDSLDLAEIMVGIEREFGRSPFDAVRPPRTWEEVVTVLESVRGGVPTSGPEVKRT